MKKQTAVEWLVEQLPIRIINSYQSEIAKAKEMEREQIGDAFGDGKWDWNEHILKGKEPNQDLDRAGGAA